MQYTASRRVDAWAMALAQTCCLSKHVPSVAGLITSPTCLVEVQGSPGAHQLPCCQIVLYGTRVEALVGRHHVHPRTHPLQVPTWRLRPRCITQITNSR